MDLLNQLPESVRGIAWLVFGVLVSVGAAFAYLRGKKEGPPAPKVQEFYASGQISDMGPVRELVEQTGLLFQQQVKTTMLQGQTNELLGQLAATLKEYVEDRRKAEAEKDIADEIDRESDRKARILAEDIVRRHEEEQAAARRPARKPRSARKHVHARERLTRPA